MKAVCPRCGLPGRLERYESNGRVYLRVVHGSKRSRRYCYLGPAGDYEIAGPLLQLPLSNLKDVDYVMVVDFAASKLLDEAKLKGYGERVGEHLAAVRRLRLKLEQLLARAKAVEEELERLREAAEKAELQVWGSSLAEAVGAAALGDPLADRNAAQLRHRGRGEDAETSLAREPTAVGGG
ncbi:MAG: hypothetical protein LM580_05555 [Thermofilum sp.]|nr:hypothetical protein [Thermofilum sp.]